MSATLDRLTKDLLEAKERYLVAEDKPRWLSENYDLILKKHYLNAAPLIKDPTSEEATSYRRALGYFVKQRAQHGHRIRELKYER